MKYVLKIKGEGISEAIHTFLMSECYSCSWDNRFYSSEVAFSETNPSTKDAVKKMVAATNKMIDEDRFIKGLLTYNGWINSIYSTADGLRIIQIKVKIETTGLVSKTICEHDYYDLYKRDLLDSLGETIGIFYDQENKDKNEHGVPPEVSACFKKSNAGVITDFKYQPKAVDTSNILK
ncbi:MAG TPA: hypothetical protein PKK26_19930 [Candidatus Wallbacteria bacterium]|nr:hypothetical protein [Candidatus Wallbacteria bacterium]